MKDSNLYYYNQLNKQQQKAYHAMKTGLLSMSSSFLVPRLEGRELLDIFFLLRLDCPEIFYCITFTYRFYPDSEYVEMKFLAYVDHFENSQTRITYHDDGTATIRL